MATLFFSYSHRDEDLRDELEIHLSSLKRQGIIEVWHDRRIGAGDEFERDISEHLENADIVLLLVSSYFIASKYCNEIEIKRALERHNAGEAHVIPVILRPCNWKGQKFGHLLATPMDGKPVSKFPDPHDAFLEVTLAISMIAEGINALSAILPTEAPREAASSPAAASKQPAVRSSNLRIKKSFSQLEKDRFMLETYEYLANFFEGSLLELERRNSQAQTEYRRIDTNHFTAALYINGSEVSRCKIWLAPRGSILSGIAFLYGYSQDDSSRNDTISVSDDGYTLFLSAFTTASLGSRTRENMAFEGAAEYYWGLFIKSAQS